MPRERRIKCNRSNAKRLQPGKPVYSPW